MKCESCGKESVGTWTVCPACGRSAGVVQTVAAVPVAVAHEVAKGSVEVGTSVLKGTETVGHDLAKGAVEARDVVVNATETAAHDLAEAGKQLGRGTEDAMTRVGDQLKPHTTPIAVEP